MKHSRWIAAAALVALVAFAGADEAAKQPYTLSTCPISGKPLTAKGDPVIKTIEGREVRFCCNGCVKTFEANAEEKFAELDAKLAADQKPYYPLTTCVVSGEEFDGEPQQAFVGNRLVLLCCDGCADELKSKPEKVLNKLDQAVRRAQEPVYPLDTCLVSGEKLGGMGKAHDMVVAGRLVKLCCKRCVGSFMKDPASHLAKLDDAWKLKGGVPKAGAHGDHGRGRGADHDDDDDDDEHDGDDDHDDDDDDDDDDDHDDDHGDHDH